MFLFIFDYWLLLEFLFLDVNLLSFGIGFKLLNLFRVCLIKGVEVVFRLDSLDFWKCCLEFSRKFGEKFKGFGLYNLEVVIKEVEGWWLWGLVLGFWRFSFLGDRIILVNVLFFGLFMEKLFVWVKGRIWLFVFLMDVCKDWFSCFRFWKKIK